MDMLEYIKTKVKAGGYDEARNGYSFEEMNDLINSGRYLEPIGSQGGQKPLIVWIIDPISR
jgi:hypothetical protein